MTNRQEIFISVDIEASGPIPGEFSLLTIGACEVYNPENSFSGALKPITSKFDPEAMAVIGLTHDSFQITGEHPIKVLEEFRDWVSRCCGADSNPVFVGFNAAFDWSFINYYFHRFLNANPFGFSALDIKSMYLGAFNTSWQQTKSSQITTQLNPVLKPNHEALRDAQFQAEIFRLIREKTNNSLPSKASNINDTARK